VLAAAILSAVIFAVAIRMRLPAAEARAYVEHAADDADDVLK
jgi:hypothetical protein